MKMYLKNSKRSKEIGSTIPNILAYTVIKNFLGSREFRETRDEYSLKTLKRDQIDQIMLDVKWFFKNYKNLEVLTIEDKEDKTIRFIL